MRRGDYITTRSGIRFYVLDPRPEEIEIRDIAWALCRAVRWTAHCRDRYTVGDHSIIGARLILEMSPLCECTVDHIVCPPDEFCRAFCAFCFLLHDASETYLPDLARPIKHDPEFAFYRATEQRLDKAIAQRFGLPYPMLPEVKRMDYTMLIAEGRDQMKLPAGDMLLYDQPLAHHIPTIRPVRYARREFLRLFRQLQPRKAA